MKKSTRVIWTFATKRDYHAWTGVKRTDPIVDAFVMWMESLT